MTVKELIEKLQEIEDKDAEIIFTTPGQYFDWMKLLPIEGQDRNLLVIGGTQIRRDE